MDKRQARELEQAKLDLAKDVTDAGGLLSCGSCYIKWIVGSDSATLDGIFSAAELRAIADHMDPTSTAAE